MFSVVLAAAVAFLVTVLLGSKFIEFLQSRKFGQFVREEGPQTHLIKAGTPTMGGIVMLTGLLGALLVVARPNVATLTTLLLVAVVAGIGLYDLSSEAAQKTGEWRDGIGKLLDAKLGVPFVLRDLRGAADAEPTERVIAAVRDRAGLSSPGVW